jgi:hypothetical protein
MYNIALHCEVLNEASDSKEYIDKVMNTSIFDRRMSLCTRLG